jgi:hypothetical protein
MRRTDANREVLAFVLRHGLDKVDNLDLWDYTTGLEHLEEEMPLTYARIEKEVKDAIKRYCTTNDEDLEEEMMKEEFTTTISKASTELSKMVWVD